MCRKVKVQNTCTAISTPQAATTNAEPVTSFTMAALAGNDALRGERYCGSKLS